MYQIKIINNKNTFSAMHNEFQNYPSHAIYFVMNVMLDFVYVISVHWNIKPKWNLDKYGSPTVFGTFER